jgi:hypothetical protein
MASKVTLQRSLRSRWSVKDLPEHFVKDVMELNKKSQLWATRGATCAPWKTARLFSTFAPAQRLDVRMEESWLKSKAVSMVGVT